MSNGLLGLHLFHFPLPLPQFMICMVGNWNYWLLSTVEKRVIIWFLGKQDNWLNGLFRTSKQWQLQYKYLIINQVLSLNKPVPLRLSAHYETYLHIPIFTNRFPCYTIIYFIGNTWSKRSNHFISFYDSFITHMCGKRSVLISGMFRRNYRNIIFHSSFPKLSISCKPFASDSFVWVRFCGDIYIPSHIIST